MSSKSNTAIGKAVSASVFASWKALVPVRDEVIKQLDALIEKNAGPLDAALFKGAETVLPMVNKKLRKSWVRAQAVVL